MSDTSDLAAEQPNTAGDSLIAVLDELIDNVTEARGMPMSASAIVNRSEILDLLGTARDIVPDQIHAADSIISEAGEVRAEAQRRARDIMERARHESERIVAEAKEQAARMISEHEITEGARRRSSDIIAEARAQAHKLNAGANRYTDDALGSLQKELESLLSQVRAGREEVARRSKEAEAQAPGPNDSVAPKIGPDENYEDPYLERDHRNSRQAEPEPRREVSEPRRDENAAKPFDSIDMNRANSPVNTDMEDELVLPEVGDEDFEPPYDAER